MHERALLNDLVAKLDEVSTQEDGARIVGVRVRLGALSHFTPEHFREHFDFASRGTVAEGAEIATCLDADVTAERARDVVIESVEVETR